MCKVSLSQTSYPPDYSHLGISMFISLHRLSSPSQTRTSSEASRLFSLKKMHPSYHTLSATEGALKCPSSSSMRGDHHPTITVRVPLRLCPLSTHAAHAEQALHGLYHLQAFWSPSHHCELPTRLQAVSTAGTEPRCQKQQTGSTALIAEDGCDAFSTVTKNPSSVRTGWQNSAVLMTTFGYLQWQDIIKQVRNTLPNTRKEQRLLCLSLAQHPLYYMLKAPFETREKTSQIARNSAISEAAAIKQQSN